MKKYGIIIILVVILVAFTKFTNTNYELGIEENPKVTSPTNNSQEPIE